LTEFLEPKQAEMKARIDSCYSSIEAKLLEFKKSGNALFSGKRLQDAIEAFAKGAQFFAR